MYQNDSRCGVFKRRSEYFAGMDDICVDGSNRNDFVMDNLVVTVQIDTAQVFLGEVPHILCVLVDVVCGSDDFCPRGIAFKHAATQFDSSDDLVCFADRDVQGLC